MTLYFHNPTEFDPQVLRVLGVSIKQEGSIGRFGTGLKYAIAGILRLRGSITITSSGTKLTFSTVSVPVRGQSVEAVFMNGELLGFGLDYGKHWEPWMLYRELLSNAWDEGGDVSSAPISAATLIEVQCPELDRVHAESADYFCRGLEPIARFAGVEVYDRPGIIYNQRVRVANDARLRFSYNFTDRMVLTEDRTLAGFYSVWCRLGAALLERDAPAAGPAHFARESERAQSAILSCIGDLGPEALKAAARDNAPLQLKQQAAHQLQKAGIFEPCPLSDRESRMFTKALDLVQELESCTADEFQFTQNIAGALGLYVPSSQQIWISRRAFNGVADLAATLLEEVLHKRHGFEDETRSFQDYLLKRLVSMAEVR